MSCSQVVSSEKVINAVSVHTLAVKGDEPIPDKFLLSASMKRSHLKDATVSLELSCRIRTICFSDFFFLTTRNQINSNEKLVSISVDKVKATATETDVVKGRTVLTSHAGKLGTIVLAVRRPGCFFCREQALALSVIVAQQDLAKDFGIVGVVKETVDQQGVVDFHDKYFPYPLYCDKTFAFYQALGDRKISARLVLNPKAIAGIMCETYLRMTSTGTSAGNLKGEGFTLGGIIVFDNNAKAMYAYEEETGKEFPVKEFLAVANAIRREKTA